MANSPFVLQCHSRLFPPNQINSFLYCLRCLFWATSGIQRVVCACAYVCVCMCVCCCTDTLDSILPLPRRTIQDRVLAPSPTIQTPEERTFCSRGVGQGSPLFSPDFGQDALSIFVNALLSWESGEPVLPAQMSQLFESLNILSCRTGLTIARLMNCGVGGGGGSFSLLQEGGALSLPGRSVLDPKYTEGSSPAGSPLLAPWGSTSRVCSL